MERGHADAKVEIMITTARVRGEAQRKDNEECKSEQDEQDSQCRNEEKDEREEKGRDETYTKISR